VLNSGVLRAQGAAGSSAAPAATVKDIGKALMEQYVLPLEVIGLLLTAAMIGAVIIALKEPSQIDNSGRKS